MDINQEAESLYNVVVNAEEQYSIWPAFKPIPEGWEAVGVSGNKETCLAHIKKVWVDMRPLSLRKKISEEEKKRNSTSLESEISVTSKENSPSSIIDFLTNGIHPISVTPTNKNGPELEESLKRMFVHVTFTDTRGNTTVGIKVDPKKTILNAVDFENQKGTLHIEGTFVLDYVYLRCYVDIILSDLTGSGRLEILEHLKPFQALSNSFNI